MAFVPGSFTARGSIVFTSSQNWTVPAGVHRVKIIAVGGGGGGGGGYSSTYTGGGGGAGGSEYSEALVNPGETLSVVIGAGGSPGTGGASPTAGGNGGASYVNTSDGYPAVVGGGGGGGGAATSSANGSDGSGGNPTAVNMRVIGSFGVQGSNGQGVYLSGSNIVPLGAAAPTSLTIIPTGYLPQVGNSGGGGNGGAVNSNGGAGQSGIVFIWWGDD